MIFEGASGFARGAVERASRESAMGIREWTEKHPKAVVSLVVACICVTITTVVVQVSAGRRAITTQAPDGFFTVDDGKTFFTASANNIPPFDWNGQPAVAAHVFESSGKRFVGYVERFNAEAHKLMVENKGNIETQISGREMKKPGDAKWVRSDDHQKIAKIVNVQSPDGSSQVPDPVEP
jgi:hypothetical protein